MAWTSSSKNSPRRTELRKKFTDQGRPWDKILKAEGAVASIGIAVVFWLMASGIVAMREGVVPYRPGQYVPHDIVSRVSFSFKNKDLLTAHQRKAREDRPHIFQATDDPLLPLQELLLSLPDEVANVKTIDQLPAPLNEVLDSGSITRLQQYRHEQLRPSYNRAVRSYIESLRAMGLIVLTPDDHREQSKRLFDIKATPDAEPVRVAGKDVLTWSLPEHVVKQIRSRVVANFLLELQPKVEALTLKALARPTHVLDEENTVLAQNNAERNVDRRMGLEEKPANLVIVRAGKIEDRDWQLLKAENDEFINSLDRLGWKRYLGAAAMAGMITVVLAGYVAIYQPKVVRNHARAVAIGALLLSMLFLGEAAGIGSSILYFFGLAPTLLVAMILATAYDQRFAMGVSSMHALLVTFGLGQGIAFFMILWVGILTCCFILDDIRTRSKLIEVGGAS
ncbi:MAG: hypothetical protein ACREIT_08430, partial [Tepidisphaeraceae bacterium]